ncbi:MAG: VWA domain-containing protein [Flavobacteriales bacterium]|nr:VWA domain-containing protein [Flavobacteriales bacterium]
MSARTTYRWGIAALALIAIEVLVAAVFGVLWWTVDHEVPAFRFDRPDMLWGLLAGPVLLLIFIIELAWRDRALRRFADTATRARMVPGISTLRPALRYLTLRSGLGFAVIALAAPQFGSHPEEVKSKGIDLVVAMDVSNSMDCEDLGTSRMLAGKRALEQLVDRLKGDRLGVVVFAGDAFVQLPLTSDRSAARMFIRTINTGTIATQGTAIGAAIDLAHRSFSPEISTGKAIIVVTDGENHEDDAVTAALSAAADGIVVHTVGIGTPQGGPIPIRRNGQIQGFRKDRAGNTVVSRLDEALLIQIAAAGNGLFVRSTGSSTGIVELVDRIKAMEGAETGTVQYTAHDDRFQYPLAAALVCFLFHLLLGERRNPDPIWKRIMA